jgi:hypothetical protein
MVCFMYIIVNTLLKGDNVVVVVVVVIIIIIIIIIMAVKLPSFNLRFLVRKQQ